MNTGKILIVDDDAEDLAIITDAINRIHQSNITITTENGALALDLLHEFEKNDQLPCLIVLDLNMPRMNGKQTLEQLKNHPRFCRIPVIIYSTSINPQEKEACLLLGARAYITKPISYSECIATAKIFIQYCNLDEVNVNK